MKQLERLKSQKENLVLTNTPYYYKFIIIMTQTIAITNNWQIHIPKSIRELLGLKKAGSAAIETDRKRIIITPVKSNILQYAGKYEKKAQAKKIKVEKIRDLIDYSNL